MDTFRTTKFILEPEVSLLDQVFHLERERWLMINNCNRF
jgi:hypothetical protein